MPHTLHGVQQMLQALAQAILDQYVHNADEIAYIAPWLPRLPLAPGPVRPVRMQQLPSGTGKCPPYSARHAQESRSRPHRQKMRQLDYNDAQVLLFDYPKVDLNPVVHSPQKESPWLQGHPFACASVLDLCNAYEHGEVDD